MAQCKFFLVSTFFYICDGFNAHGKGLQGSRIYEYGKRVDGDEINYAFNGVIPKFQPHTEHVVDPAALRPDLVKNFTYLNVDYASPVSFINLDFNVETFTLSFYVKMPFVDIPFTITGYSVDKETFDNLGNMMNNASFFNNTSIE